MSYVNGLLCCNNAFIKAVITVLDLIAVVILYSSLTRFFLKLEFSLLTNRLVLILGWQPHHWWRYLWCGEWKLPYQTQDHAAPTEQGYSYIHCSARKLWHFSKSPKQKMLVYSMSLSYADVLFLFCMMQTRKCFMQQDVWVNDCFCYPACRDDMIILCSCCLCIWLANDTSVCCVCWPLEIYSILWICEIQLLFKSIILVEATFCTFFPQ